VIFVLFLVSFVESSSSWFQHFLRDIRAFLSVLRGKLFFVVPVLPSGYWCFS
jgi:hypothetical protein